MNEQLKTHIAAQIRNFRKQAGITQAELAERIERTTEAVSNLERAKSLPSIETVMALAIALDVPIRDFFPDNDGERKISVNRLQKEVEAINTIKRLADKQLDVALAQIKALGEL